MIKMPMHRMYAPLLALLALIASAALAGCGGDAPTAKVAVDTSKAAADTGKVAAAPSDIDSLGLPNPDKSGRKPCEYMQRADAETAVGLALPQTTEHVALGMCDYMSPEFYGASLTIGDWEGIKAAATSGSKQPDAIAAWATRR